MNDGGWKIPTTARRGATLAAPLSTMAWDGAVKELGAPLFSPLLWRVFVFCVTGVWTRQAYDYAAPHPPNTSPFVPVHQLLVQCSVRG